MLKIKKFRRQVMYQIKIFNSHDLQILEDLINMWLMEHANLNVVDIKFTSNSTTTNNFWNKEYAGIIVWEKD